VGEQPYDAWIARLTADQFNDYLGNMQRAGDAEARLLRLLEAFNVDVSATLLQPASAAGPDE
jgi:hypothetical protein